MTKPATATTAATIATAPPLPIAPPVRQIELRGVRVHNLKQIDLDIPLGQFVVLSGVSGSGKSSLAFDTIFAEGQRRYIESFSASARQYLERIERPDADRIAHVPPAVAIRTDSATHPFSPRATVASLVEIDSGLRRLFARIGHVICPGCGGEVRSHSAGDLVGAVSPLAAGTRFQLCFAPSADSFPLPTDAALSPTDADPLADDGRSAPAAWRSRGFSRAILAGQTRSLDELPGDVRPGSLWIVADRLVAGTATVERIAESADTAFREGNGRCILLVDANPSAAARAGSDQFVTVDNREWQAFRFSRHWECAACQREFVPPELRLFDADFGGGCPACRDSKRRDDSMPCGVCHGTRLCAEALAVQIGGRHIADVLPLTVEQGAEWCRALSRDLTGSELTLSQPVREEIERRLDLVSELGLGHLNLLRSAQSLSGGEIRRLMLAAAIGSRITGTLCLIDEPSAGLHRTEIPLVIRAVRRLIGLRNSVIVVDHAPEIIRAADHVIDLGPGAGPQGGTVVFAGTPRQLATVEVSATGRALRDERARGEESEPVPNPRPLRPPSDWLTLEGITHRNLRDLTVRIPLGVLCVVGGPGGSGKTSLVMDVLVPAVRDRLNPAGEPSAFDRDRNRCRSVSGGASLVDVTVVDRTPLTRSSRSNAATWIEVFDDIRDLFAMTAEAKLRGFGSQHFSFNAPQGGRCRACRGTGVLRHDMQFLPDVTLDCPECGGTRYRREILDVKYRGRSIADVLSMSAAEAALFFRNQPRLQSRLQMLKQIGLDYLVLGQPTETLSGGEAQRLKLAARLTSGRGPTLIVCDEATAGLHPADVTRLIGCFDELLGIGHSLVVIDNSPDLQRAADHIIELGPGSGAGGGRLVAEGPRLGRAVGTQPDRRRGS